MMFNDDERDDWEEVFKYANIVASPRPRNEWKSYRHEVTIDDVVEVVAKANGENEGPDWVGLFRLQEGTFLAVRAWCDFTGWGCQEGGNGSTHATKEDAIRFGLGDEERERLGLAVPR